MIIKFYRLLEPGGFMSNFWRAKITIYGRIWDTTEHAYQSQKTSVPGEIDKIWACKTPKESRLLGQICQLRPDWDDVKDRVMKECCIAKFTQHADLKKLLLETGDAELIEDSPVDWYWGCGKDGTGKNMLGKILMEIRAELRDEKTTNNLV